MQVHFEALLLAGNCCKTYINDVKVPAVLLQERFFPLVFPSLYT